MTIRHISDAEFAYIGLTPKQIDRLANEPEDLRLLVYEEQLRLLMEADSYHDDIEWDKKGL